jgi:hypothetical protein
VTWAFVGGIFLDILSGGPMGSSSLALMAAAAVAGFGHTTLSRFNVLVPLGAIIVGTVVYGLVYAGTLLALNGLIDVVGINVLQHELPFWETVQAVIIPATIYNTVLMLVLIPVLNRIPETPERVSVLQ